MALNYFDYRTSLSSFSMCHLSFFIWSIVGSHFVMIGVTSWIVCLAENDPRNHTNEHEKKSSGETLTNADAE